MSSQSSTQSYDGSFYPGSSSAMRRRVKARPSKSARAALRPYKGVIAVPRPMMGRTNGTYKISRKVSFSLTYANGGIDIIGNVSQGIGFVFNPTAVVVGNAAASSTYGYPNIAEIAALWDRLKIDKVVMEVYARNQDPINGIANASTPVIYYASDYNDVANTSLAIMQQQGDTKTWYANSTGMNPLVYTCYPKFQRLVQFSTLASSFEPASGYVVSDTAIPHYGIRMAMDTNNYNGSGILSFVFTCHFSVKNVK